MQLLNEDGGSLTKCGVTESMTDRRVYDGPSCRFVVKIREVNNFVALPGQSVNSSWERFTSFLRSVPNHRIDDESLKEYFYRGQDDNNNNKAVLDTIAGGSYGECPYTEIAENLEKISRNNKA